MSKAEYLSVMITMPPEMVRYLKNLGIDIRSSPGSRHLGMTEIVRAAIRLCQEIEIDFSNIKSEEDLLERWKQALNR